MTNRIDFDKMTFSSNDHQYYIDLDTLSYARMMKFMEWTPTLAFDSSFSDIKNFAKDLIQTISSGNDLGKNYFDVSTKIVNFYDRVKVTNEEKFFEQILELHLDFCALFTNRINEDTNVYHEPTMIQKKNDWKKDMNMLDFFLLARLQLPSFRATLRESLEEKAAKIRATQNRK